MHAPKRPLCCVAYDTQLTGNTGWVTGALCNSAVFTLGYKVLRKGLTPAGVAHAWFLGASIFSAFGLGGYVLVCLYFIFGTLVRNLPVVGETVGHSS